MQVYIMTYKSVQKKIAYSIDFFLTTSFICISQDKSFEICTPRFFIVSAADSTVPFMRQTSFGLLKPIGIRNVSDKEKLSCHISAHARSNRV